MSITMRKVSCWAIIAVLTIHMSIYSMDYTNNTLTVESNDSDDVSQTLGRQSSGMQGNEPGNNPGCNFTNIADGMGGPVWDGNATYNMNDIVEWPAGSGQFWQSTTDGPTGEPSSAGKWIGPCDCAEISEISGIVWHANATYDPWQIVDHNGSIWIAQDAGANPGQEPVVGTDLWVMCEDSTPCDELIGMTNIVAWNTTMLVSEGEIYEHPADSGNFYMVAPYIANQTVGAPGVDMDAWDQEFCDCKDIWSDSGEPVWDASLTYPVNAVVEHPSGSGDIWIATAPSTTAGVEPGQPWADGNEWDQCGPEDNTTGGPCGGMESVGVWDNLTRVSTGEIYEYPAGSQTYYEVVIQGYVDQEVDSPTVDDDGVWAPVDCPCKETWETNGQPVWDSSVTYWQHYVVEWPSGSGELWIALDNDFTGAEPSLNDPSWKKCNEENTSSGGPCADLDVEVWSNATVASIGDIYEYPANSGMYYQVTYTDANGVITTAPGEAQDEEFWTPYSCPCKETWVANGEPVWDASTTYWLNEVVEWPAGSGTLWIAIDNGFMQSEPTLTALDWKHCADSTMPSSNPCAGLDVVGVWDDSNTPVIGDVYEFPANSGTYWEIIFDHEGNITDPESNGAEEFWAPVDCPCKETWVANGQPVWTSGTAYPGNYVVEHPAGSGNLYIPLESGGVSVGGGEPGVDIHWVLCNGDGPSPGPCEGLDVEVWSDATVASVGDIYEYPANSGMYYQVTYTDANGVITTAPGEAQDDEFWTPYSCPCKETWVANGQPVWDNSISFYSGNYVVEWPAGSGMLYLAEGGGITGAGEPGTDVHWIPCDSNPEPELEQIEESEAEGLPSIGALTTLLGILAASAFVRRDPSQE